MKTLYLECCAGASGDMILGALTDLLDDPREFQKMMESIGIPNVQTSLEKGSSNGICGKKVHIAVNGVEEKPDHAPSGEHHHHTLSDVQGIISRLNISENVRKHATEIYRTIAEAESKVHGKPVDLVHFHEVGALDAVADIVGACMLFEKLSPERIVVSPIRTGFGETRCAHGIIPVPAPATALILAGLPIYSGNEEGEFCTPTGAAILRHFATEYGTMPAFTFDRIGTGIGSKEFRIANILRAYIGESGNGHQTIKEICCNVDDMSPEDAGIVIDLLLRNGALDAFIKPCIMKKGRPGFEITCLCRTDDSERMSMTLLENTSTIGVRIHDCERFAMTSRFEDVDTEYGTVRMKVSEGFGLRKHKPEFDVLKELSDKNGVSVSKIRNAAEKKYKE